MAIIVCERVIGNIIVFLLVSVRGTQFSLTVSLPWTRLAFQHKLPRWLSLIFVKFALWNQIIWQWVRLTEISLAYLVNLFYETGIEALEVRRHKLIYDLLSVWTKEIKVIIFQNRIALHRNSIDSIASASVMRCTSLIYIYTCMYIFTKKIYLDVKYMYI